MSDLDKMLDVFVGETVTNMDLLETEKGYELWVQFAGGMALVIGHEPKLGMYIKQYQQEDEVVH